MEAAFENTRLALPKEGLIALRDARDVRIACLAGSVWVTQEGAIKDEVLEAGQSMVVQHRGLTLVTALTPATVALTEGPAGRSGEELLSVTGRRRWPWRGFGAGQGAR